MFNYKTPSSVQNCHEVFLKYHIMHKVGFFFVKGGGCQIARGHGPEAQKTT